MQHSMVFYWLSVLNCLTVRRVISSTRNCSQQWQSFWCIFSSVAHGFFSVGGILYLEKRMRSQGPKLCLNSWEIHKKCDNYLKSIAFTFCMLICSFVRYHLVGNEQHVIFDFEQMTIEVILFNESIEKRFASTSLVSERFESKSLNQWI